MKIKKIFNILSKEQNLIVSKQFQQINEIIRCEQDALSEKFDNAVEKWELEQNKCKKCGCTDNINVITQRLRHSTNQPKFIFQQPTSYNYTTSENITECSNCGNQWRKINRYDAWVAPKREQFSFINEFASQLTNREEYPSTFKCANEKFKDFYAESMYDAFYELVSLKTLRKIYKSIHD